MRILSVTIMLAMMGLYTLQGWAQESSAGTAPPVDEGANTSPLSEDVPAVTAGEKTDNQPANKAPATSKPSGFTSATDKIVARFMELDTDMSAGVSFQEYMAMVQKRAEARYAGMDANRDGEVTDEEYRKFWKLRMAQWYRLKR